MPPDRRAVPALPAGGVRVRVCAARVLPFSHAVLAGGLPFELPTPYTFGSSAVGVVEELAPRSVALIRAAFRSETRWPT